jgi:polyphosphate glucokinase
MTRRLGIEITRSGIKGSVVDLNSGILATERVRVSTPHQAKPKPVIRAVMELTANLSWTGPTGIAFPGVVRDGVIPAPTDLDSAWIGMDARECFADATGLTIEVINAADAAGVAEMRFGTGAGVRGAVLILTVNTKIDSAFFMDGSLLPNTHFGLTTVNGVEAEMLLSDNVRKEHKVSWAKWAKRADEYFAKLDFVAAPSLIIIGGPLGKKSDEFLPLLSLSSLRTDVRPATIYRDAAIIGAAIAAGG